MLCLPYIKSKQIKPNQIKYSRKQFKVAAMAGLPRATREVKQRQLQAQRSRRYEYVIALIRIVCIDVCTSAGVSVSCVSCFCHAVCIIIDEPLGTCGNLTYIEIIVEIMKL